MRRMVLVVGLGLAALIVVFFVLSADVPAPLPAIADIEPNASAIDPAAPLIEDSVSRSVAEAAPGPVAAIDASRPPESYTRFLGGVIGRIIDVDGTPVPDMKIEALAATLSDFLIDTESLFAEKAPTFDEVKDRARTDAEGRFRFANLEPRGVYLLGIDFGGPRATIRFIDKAPNPGQVVDLGDLQLDPFVVFTGRVIDEQGAPIAAARVRATNLPALIFNFGVQNLRPGFSVAFQDDLRSAWRLAPIPTWVTRIVDRFPVPTTVSADDGRFRLAGVPLGMVSVLVDKTDLVSLVHGPTPSGNGGERDLGDLRLTAGETLVGRVVDLDDQPVAGADIMAGPRIEIAPAALMLPVGKSDAEGRFVVRGLTDVEHVVAARRAGAADWAVLLDVVPGYDEAIIRIGETWQLHVTVRDPDGEIVPRPAIVLQKRDRIPLHPLLVPPIDLARRLSYKDDGTVLIRELDPARYAVLARAKGFAVGKVEADLIDGSAEVEIQLVPEVALQLEVLAKGDGSPVHWATASVFDHLAADREMRRVPLMSRRTDENGKVTLPGLEVGEYTITVFHPAYAQAIAKVMVPGDVVRVELQSGGTLKGVILSGNRPPDEERFITVAEDKMTDFPRFSVTDANGEFEVTHLNPGEHRVVIMRRFANQGLTNLVGKVESFIPERFEQVTIREGEVTWLKLDVKETGEDGPVARLSGRVMMNGRAAEGMTMQHSPSGKWRGIKSAVTDRTGRFDFGEVLAGKGTVSMRQSSVAGRFQFGRMSSRTVELVADENKEIVIEIYTGTLSGKVVADRDSAPLSAAEVVLRAADSENEWTDGTRMQTASGRDGTFAFDEVPAGSYTLRVQRMGFAQVERKDIEVPARGQPTTVEIRMVSGVEVSGRVELASGTEAPRWMFVEFRGKDGGGRSGAQVDGETGEFVVKGLMPGSYEVRVLGRDMRLSADTVEVGSSGESGLVLHPHAEAPPPPQSGN